MAAVLISHLKGLEGPFEHANRKNDCGGKGNCKTDANDWMTTDTDIACPDPNCGAVFRISRTGETVFRHGDVTAVPLHPNGQ